MQQETGNPRANNMVSNQSNAPLKDQNEDYHRFLRQRDSIKEELENIAMIKDYHLKQAKFEDVKKRKPTLQKAKELKLKYELENLDPFLDDKSRESINQEIKAYQAWTQKSTDYFHKYARYVADDEFELKSNMIIEMTRGLNLIKEEANLLVLKDEEIENSFWKFQWKYQARLLERSGKKGSMHSELKNWKELLKMAKNQEEILESKKYKEIVKEIEGLLLLMKDVLEIMIQEKSLLEGSKRENLKSQEDVESLLMNLRESKICTLNAEKMLEELFEKMNKALIGYDKIKNCMDETSFYKARQIWKRLAKIPVKFSQEIEHHLTKETLINELLGKCPDNSKLDFSLAKEIYNEYTSCPFEIPQAQEICNQYIEFQGLMKKIGDVVQSQTDLTYKEIRDLEKQVENFSFDFGVHLDEMKVDFWLAKVNLIKLFKLVPHQRPEKLIPFRKVSEYLDQGYDLVARIKNQHKKELCMTSLDFLESFKSEISKYVMDIVKKEEISQEDSEYLGFIDLTEQILELKTRALEKKEKSLLNERKRYLKTRGARKQISNFIPLVVVDDDDVENMIDQQGGIMKRQKTDRSFIQLSQEVVLTEEKVDVPRRREAKKDLYEAVKDLEGFKNLKDSEEAFQFLEFEIYERYLEKEKYEERMKVLCHFFEKLDHWPRIRTKILWKQNFKYDVIKNYLDSSIERLEFEERRLKGLAERRNISGDNSIGARERKNIEEMNQKESEERRQKDFKGKTWESVIEIEEDEGEDIEERSQNKFFQDLQKASFDSMISQECNDYRENKGDSLTMSMPENIFSNVETIEEEINQQKELDTFGVKIFEGKITQVGKDEEIKNFDCVFLASARPKTIAEFPKVELSHLLFQKEKIDSFLFEMNNFISHRPSRWKQMVTGWIIEKKLEANNNSFSQVVDLLLRNNLVGKCSYQSGLEIYLLPNVWDEKVPEDSVASFAICALK